ncbi:hypothetical protein IQ260_12650 [Leptolyngbya cf. ectocarpi LEGE 11479]|uniref:Uncharacterized protein n=1 Tax=Leptolyngbya cf. ectocarpi LEGE 11479 TaxID=1828722 RepID=A0A929F9P2_LEPEC|nr:hypothetical protein [Leptolyngbya ectocarpi]MBE9067508.1 hypothetical protein [Leptolyngbya cf. ectocarpi LEGE 11479]
MEFVVVIGAVFISILVFTWLLNVVKATLKTAFLAALILLGLQLFFGIGPNVIWETIRDWLGQAGSTAR